MAYLETVNWCPLVEGKALEKGHQFYQVSSPGDICCSVPKVMNMVYYLVLITSNVY